MKQMFEVVARAAQLLAKLGAKIENDSIWLTVAFREKGNEYGLQFTRGFNIGILMDGGHLYYGIKFGGGPIRYVRVLPYWAEADVEKGIYPATFWDALYRMARRLRNYVFERGLADVSLTWELRRTVWQRHCRRPCRESLLLLRSLTKFIEEEGERARGKARAANVTRREAYEELLRLTAATPHSLNILQKQYPEAVVKMIVPSYWRASVVIGGEEVAEWGADPLSAAQLLIKRIEEECRRSGRTVCTSLVW